MLNNLSIKSKLLLSVTLSLLGMIYFASININDKYCKFQDATKIHNIVLLDTKISSLVHELQKERGISSGFVSSRGKSFHNRLIKQKKSTDKTIVSLKKQLTNFRQKNSKFAIFKQNLVKQVENLSAARTQTKSLTINNDKVMKKYSENINFLLDFIYTTFKDTNNVDIAGKILLYSDFLHTKENVGLERALTVKMLINNSMYIDNRLKLSNLIALQKTSFKKFFKIFKNSEIEKYRNSIHNNKLHKEIEEIEEILLFSNGPYNISPFEWFQKITKKIEHQNLIANKLSEQLIASSNNLKKEAKNDVLVYIAITLIILLCVIFLFLVIIKNINRSVDEILSAIVNISKNKISKFEKIKLDTKDEFKLIANTLNEMTERLMLRDKENQEKNIKIKKAEERAVNSAKAKSEFLANMSHEIRTPLNAVLGFIDLLKEESKGRKANLYVEIIDNSTKSLLNIIEDILDFSKIESGKLNIDKIDFNAKAEFEVITYLFEAKCSQKNISLTLNLDTNLPQIINTDPLRIKQIISNLLSNAIKFTQSGKKIIVDIGYKNNLLSIFVQDEGKGIAKDKLEHIFEAFSQEDNSTTREFGGTGLGLSISSELVKLLGGELKVTSELNVGSKFYFSIPVTEGEEIKLKITNNENLNFENKRILLVEDNKANQMFMKIILKKMKLKFDIANDGIEAIEAFKNNQYDVILMDENMPNLNGIEATKKIIEMEIEQNLKHTPIIAITANALKGDRERFLEAGMDEYLTKPLDKQKLNNILKIYLINTQL